MTESLHMPARRTANAAMTLALAAAALAGLSVVGIHIGLWPPLAGFKGFVAAMGLLGAGALACGLVGMFRARRSRAGQPWRRALTASLVGLCLVATLVAIALPGRDLPRINDISTDLADPPEFVAAATAPANTERDMSYPQHFAKIVRAHYPDIRPLTLSAPSHEVLQAARSTAESLGWKVIAGLGGSTFEASATSHWFQFVDDIVIRVRTTNGESVIDMRSKSRDGQGDFGVNANRIRAFMSALASH